MVLTGKRALDYSGGVSAEDNQGIGGYERIMGPNGQAQYFARDIGEACQILFRHYDHTYVAPGERFPRRAADRATRRTATSAPTRTGAATSTASRRSATCSRTQATRGARSRSTSARVMQAVVDQDHPPLERWSAMARRRDRGGLGRAPRRLAGLPARHRVASRCRASAFVPADGPEQWTAGTLFPQSSKKVARAINAASGNRPVVVLANLSGFDGSPESMRQLAARVRRGDRPRGGQLPRADRVLRRLALPRRRVRGLLERAQRQLRGGRARGHLRLGHRRRPRGGGRVRPRGGRSGRRRTRG